MNRVEKMLSARNQLLKAMDIAYTSHKDGGWCFKLPGLKNDDFNRAGLPDIARITRFDEIVRLKPTDVSIFGDTDKSSLPPTFVVKGRLWTFTPELYRRASINLPLTMRLGSGRIGNTSCDMVHLIYASDDQTKPESASKEQTHSASVQMPIMFSVSRMVCIDPMTAQPTPLKESFIRTLKANTIHGFETFPTMTLPASIPQKSFKWRVPVRYDDLDVLFHANQSSYFLYATECAAHAASQNFYSRITEDVAFYPVRRAVGLHMAEAFAGDELDVYTWEDADDQMRLNFAVNKEDSMIFYAQLDFFDSVILPSSL